MIWIVLLLCLSVQALAGDISDDYTGKDEDTHNINGDDNMMLRKNVDHKKEDKAQTRRVFDWFKNLFGIKHNANGKVKHVNRTGIDQKIEKTEQNILESINRIADAMDKISSSVDLQLHMMVPIDNGFDISTHHDSTRNDNKTEYILESNTTENLTTLDYLEPIYRIANTLEKINNNMELQLHMILAKKDRVKNLNKYDSRSSRKSTFDWMYNIIFGKNKTNHPSSPKRNTTLYDLLSTPIDENTESDILEGVDRIGFALERINTNLELKLHMKLDCSCEDGTRTKRKYDIHKRATRMDRNFYEIVNNGDDNNPMTDSNVRRKRDAKKNPKDTEASTTKPTALRDGNATDAPLSVTTETIIVSRRQEGDEVKLKLLNYVYESYNEMINKIDPLAKIKAKYQNEMLYKIGYVMSNIDTLEVNLKNMKKEVDINKQEFEETKIMSVLDTFMASNRIVSSLVDSLKLLEKPSEAAEKNVELLEKPVDLLNLQNNNNPVIPIN